MPSGGDLRAACEDARELGVRQAAVAVMVRFLEQLLGLVPIGHDAASRERDLQLRQAGLHPLIQLEVEEVPVQLGGIRQLSGVSIGGLVVRLREQPHCLMLPAHTVPEQVADVVCHLEDAQAQEPRRRVGTHLVRLPVLVAGVRIAVPLREEHHLKADQEVHRGLCLLLLIAPIHLQAPHERHEIQLGQEGHDDLLPEGKQHDELDAEKLADGPDMGHPLARVLALAQVLEEH
mmetsp:Transcript_44115/g.140521  ORF Transcript_44115/g.140521 Transcript_44115/m.140521 type:complete len:233 (+) Transcript_44115:82-780(+)